MGLFDEIKCDYPLPVTMEMVDFDIDVQDVIFQTKDFENLMEEYIISEDGELLLVKKSFKWVEDGSQFFKGHLEEIDSKIVPADFHGKINFYCYEDLPEMDGVMRVFDAEYEAKFTDNKLVDLQLVDCKIIDNTQHVKDLNELFDKREQEMKKWKNKYFWNTLPMIKFKKFVCRFFYNLHTFTGKLHSFSIRHL